MWLSTKRIQFYFYCDKEKIDHIFNTINDFFFIKLKDYCIIFSLKEDILTYFVPLLYLALGSLIILNHVFLFSWGRRQEKEIFGRNFSYVLYKDYNIILISPVEKTSPPPKFFSLNENEDWLLPSNIQNLMSSKRGGKKDW